MITVLLNKGKGINEMIVYLMLAPVIVGKLVDGITTVADTY